MPDDITVRRLTPDDWGSVEMLKLASPKHLGLPVSTFTAKPRFLTEEFSNYVDVANKRYIGIGAFTHEGDLCSYMLTLVDGEAWYVQLIVSSQEKRRIRFNGIERCTDWMIEYAEDIGIKNFWYAIPLKYAKAHRTVWRKETKLLSRYERLDVMVIPANTRGPDSRLNKLLMSDSVVPIDMLIRKNTLGEHSA